MSFSQHRPGGSLTAPVRQTVVVNGSPPVPFPQHQVNGLVPFPQAMGGPVARRTSMPPYVMPQQAASSFPMSPVVASVSPGTMLPSFSPTPSYVPPPQLPTSAPAPPMKLTEGIPDPGSIESQKVQYHRSLDEQQTQAVNIMKMQLDHQIEAIRQQSEAQKQHYNLNLDQKTGTAKISLTHQYNKQLMQLREAAHVQKNLLEQQSSGLELQYHTRKAQQDLKFARFDAQTKHYEEQMRSYEAQKAAGVKMEQSHKDITHQAAKVDQARRQSIAQASSQQLENPGSLLPPLQPQVMMMAPPMTPYTYTPPNHMGQGVGYGAPATTNFPMQPATAFTPARA